MDNLEVQPAVLHATIHITRKATGIVDTYQIIGTPVKPESEPAPEPKPEGDL